MDTRIDQVCSALKDHVPVDQREQNSVATFVKFLDALPLPFEENADPVHVTGSAIVLGPRGILMHLHKRLDRWLQPGGHIDPGETPWDGAQRETLEETGLTVEHPDGAPRLIHVDVHAGPRGHTHLDLRYLFYADDVDPSPPAGESQQVRWFTLAEALELVDESLSGLFGLLQQEIDAGRHLFVKKSRLGSAPGAN
jgi:8-oxo-dGTP pyrophosphatase MutT (NUDIX family)